jgi:hypothetical protein
MRSSTSSGMGGCHNPDMAVMAAWGCLTPLLATMHKHERDMPWVGLVLLEGLTDSVGVGPSIGKVLDPVDMDAMWAVAWPKPFGSRHCPALI